MAHVSQKKKDIVKQFTTLLKEYPIVGAVNMENLPAPQLQAMREQLRGKVEVLMTKRRLLKIAIDKVKGEKPGVEELIPHLRGMPALIFTRENPFSLFKTLKKNKSKAPAKAGQIAPNDIKVPAGPTGFAPGPVIGELGALGIKTKVDGGKIAITDDTVVCKDGEEISANLAAMLTRLNILPMEVGLDLTAAYENGTIFTKKVLDVDEEAFLQDINNAAAWAFNLSVECGYITEQNRELFIMKAFTQAKNLAVEANILADGVVDQILGKAERQMLALSGEAKFDLTKKE